MLQSTLAQWGETIKDGKTKRLRVTSGEVEKDFVAVAKLLGGMLSVSADYDADDARRLSSAKRLWARLHRQLPRFGLPDRIVGQLIYAGVVRALLFATETRAVSGKTIRKWQCFMNAVARGACRQRLSKMQEDQLTQRDLTLKLGLKQISTYIGESQLRYLGHIARSSPDRKEFSLLFSWLPRESLHGSYKGAVCSRHVFWKRITELMSFTDIPPEEYHSRWPKVAQDRGGTVWAALIRKWTRKREEEASKDTWNARHSDPLRAGRLRAAADRAFQELGVRRCDDGRYRCSQEGCDVRLSLRSMRQHIPVCSALTIEQRQERSLAAAATPEENPRRMEAVMPRSNRRLPQTAPRTRLQHKQPRPDSFLRTSKETKAADFVACAIHSLSDIHEKYESSHLTRNYRGLRLHRNMTLTDLPCPTIEPRWPPTECRFCFRKFADKQQCRKHMRCCPSMPYDGWLWRVRATLLKVPNRTIPCVHCGTCFTVPKAAGRHGVECSKRRQIAQLPLNMRQMHDLPEEPTLT